MITPMQHVKSENAQRNFNQKYNLNGFLNIKFLCKCVCFVVAMGYTVPCGDHIWPNLTANSIWKSFLN